MNRNTAAGTVKQALGEGQSAVGDFMEDPEMTLNGDARQLEGEAQHLVGRVQDAVGKTAAQIAKTTSKVSKETRTRVEQAREQARAAAEQIDPFVQEQPYVALGLAAAAGLLIGLLIAGRGPKIIYVRPRA